MVDVGLLTGLLAVLEEFERSLVLRLVGVDAAQAEKVYVQHRMREHGAALYDLIERRGGNVYICGDGANMAKVKHTCVAPSHARAVWQHRQLFSSFGTFETVDCGCNCKSVEIIATPPFLNVSYWGRRRPAGRARGSGGHLRREQRAEQCRRCGQGGRAGQGAPLCARHLELSEPRRQTKVDQKCLVESSAQLTTITTGRRTEANKHQSLVLESICAALDHS